MALDTADTPATEHKASRTETLVLAAGGALMLLLSLWLLTGVVAQVWLAWLVPLSAQDLAHASWLSSPTTALHFTTGFPAVVFCTALALMALVISAAKGSVAPLVPAALVIASVLVGSNEAAVARIGILEGTVRIGCYVPETSECRGMLGLPAQASAPSQYAHPGGPLTTSEAPWYLAQRKAVVSPALESRAAWMSVPGRALWVAPLYFAQAPRLRRLVTQQRADVLRMQTEAAEPPAASATQPRT